MKAVEGSLPDAGLTDEDLADHLAHRTTIIVAWIDHIPIGIGWINWSGPRNHQVLKRLGPIPEVHRLHVHKLYRSLGVGTKLIQSFEILAMFRHHPAIGLGVHVTNQRAAALYRRLGFVESGGHYLDEYTARRADGLVSLVRAPARYMIRTAEVPDQAATA